MLTASGRRLDVFRTIIECGGVNAAADHLDVSQPSITAHVRALEQEIGASLFKRQRGRRNVPTPAGEALYQFACESAAHRHELHGKLRDIAQHRSKSLSLAVQRNIANYSMPKVLAAFLKTHPTARVSMYSETQEAVRELAASGTVDAAFLYGDTPSGQHVIGRQDLVLIAPPSHPLAHRKKIPISEIGKYDFIGGLRNSEFYSLVERAMHSAGMHDYNVTLNLQDLVAVKSAVEQGIGIACTLACGVANELQHGRLVVLRTETPLPSLTIELLESAAPSPLFKEFIKVWERLMVN